MCGVGLMKGIFSGDVYRYCPGAKPPIEMFHDVTGSTSRLEWDFVGSIPGGALFLCTLIFSFVHAILG